MQKVFHFESAPEHYVADAAVLTCFDQRIRLAVNKFLRRRAIMRPDRIVLAGGAKGLASPRHDFECDFILDQVRLSILLHGTKRAYLFCHSDCAAYGGLAAFKGNPAVEAEHHFQELHKASAILKAAFPELEVECFLVNFEGVFVTESPATLHAV
jgi:hypothetical protein